MREVWFSDYWDGLLSGNFAPARNRRPGGCDATLRVSHRRRTRLRRGQAAQPGQERHGGVITAAATAANLRPAAGSFREPVAASPKHPVVADTIPATAATAGKL